MPTSHYSNMNSSHDQRKSKQKNNISIWPPFQDLKTEFHSRIIPYYWDDWFIGFKNSSKTLSSTLFIYFTSIMPAITFGAYLAVKTDSHYGVMEAILATGLSGIFFTLFGGQGLIVIGVTGSVTIFSEQTFLITKALNLPFLPFMCWISIWACFFIVLSSIFNGCRYLKYVTRYTYETFGALVVLIFLITAIQQIDSLFNKTPNKIESGLLGLILAMGSFYASWTLSLARKWHIGRKWFRSIISDYSIPISILIFSLIPMIPTWSFVDIPLIAVPDNFRPTINRPWIVNPFDPTLPIWAIGFAVLPGLILAILFYFDHNVTSLITQTPTFNLKKPFTYNLDFAVVGFSILIAGFFGLPFYNATLPQAPLLARSLAKIREKIDHGIKFDIVESVIETRLSNFLQSLLVVITCVIPAVLTNVVGKIPEAILPGMFLYMGFSSCFGNQFVSRLGLLCSDPSFYYHFLPTLRNAPFSLTLKKIHVFTITQALFLAAIYGVSLTPAALSFPIIILMMIPIRFKVFPRFYSPKDLDILDGEEDLNDFVSAAVDVEDIEVVMGDESETESSSTVNPQHIVVAAPHIVLLNDLPHHHHSRNSSSRLGRHSGSQEG